MGQCKGIWRMIELFRYGDDETGILDIRLCENPQNCAPQREFDSM